MNIYVFIIKQFCCFSVWLVMYVERVKMYLTLNQDVENTIFRLLSKFTRRKQLCKNKKIEEVNFSPEPSIR